MNLPVEAVDEFQKIYLNKCGIELSFNEAEIRADNFLRLMMLITKEPNIEVNNLVSSKNEK